MRFYVTGGIPAALKSFEEIDKKYPISPFIKEVKIMIPYLQYLDRQYDVAIQSIDGFLAMYPRTRHEAYLQYLRALCSYRQVTGIRKAQEMRIRSRAEMNSVAERFPYTIYGARARELVDYLDLLSIYNDLLVGQFYQNDRSYFAAINRFKGVVDTEALLPYRNLSPIAYYRLQECYHDLGIIEMEEKYKALFDDSIKHLDGLVSFDIEGLIRYLSKKDLAAQEIKRGLKVSKKLVRKNRKVLDNKVDTPAHQNEIP